MHLCISGFLIDSKKDDSIKFEFVPDKKFNDQIVQLLGHKDFYAMPAGEWLLAVEQADQISELIGYSLPTELKLYIGVEA
ncbi:pyocin S6 family toxin immunity protein [Pseudomonas sp. R1-15]|uniref:pyocin S6 family toxin immunity protein n=1 Tax=Pseudomonas sp. R1-15 TaxID=2817399 RepID=UPI003DA8F373